MQWHLAFQKHSLCNGWNHHLHIYCNHDKTTFLCKILKNIDILPKVLPLVNNEMMDELDTVFYKKYIKNYVLPTLLPLVNNRMMNEINKGLKITCISFLKSVSSKRRQDNMRHGKTCQGKARRVKTRRNQTRRFPLALKKNTCCIWLKHYCSIHQQEWCVCLPFIVPRCLLKRTFEIIKQHLLLVGLINHHDIPIKFVTSTKLITRFQLTKNRLSGTLIYVTSDW